MTGTYFCPPRGFLGEEGGVIFSSEAADLGEVGGVSLFGGGAGLAGIPVCKVGVAGLDKGEGRGELECCDDEGGTDMTGIVTPSLRGASEVSASLSCVLPNAVVVLDAVVAPVVEGITLSGAHLG